ncbi:MAG: AMP-binding protein [Planctomycetota bacterium]
MSALTAALDAPHQTAVRVREGEWIPWDALIERSRQRAAALEAHGLEPGDRLLLALPTSEELLELLLACFRLGVVPACVGSAEGVGAEGPFAARLTHVVTLLEPRAIVCEPVLVEPLSASGVPRWTPDQLTSGARVEVARALPDDALLYLQLTSGSSGPPRAVKIPRGALCANVDQIARAHGGVQGDAGVFWLPLFHDMGLVAGFLTPLLEDAYVHLLRPLDFLRRPATWLRAVGDAPGRHVRSAVPTFALAYAARRVSDQELAELDLSRLASVLVGAEPVPAPVLAAFQARFAAAGLPATALRQPELRPGGGYRRRLDPGREPYRALTLSRSALAEGGRVEPPADEADAQVLVGNGPPLPDVEVWIADGEGRRLPEGEVGQVLVQGENLHAGYVGEPPREGPLETGDLGFLYEGQLYVTGRIKDVIILRGHNHHPAEVEWAAQAVPGVRPGRVAAFGAPGPDGLERLSVLLELERGAELPTVTVGVRRAVRAACGLSVDGLRVVERGEFPVTTSGKVRRGAARAMFLRLEAAEGA